MAVIAIPRHSVQAIAGRFDIVEGRGVHYTSKSPYHDDLYAVEYPKHKEAASVWIAMFPHDKFKPPVLVDLFYSINISTYNVNDATIYTDPILQNNLFLTPPSSQSTQATIIASRGLVALYKGIIGITPDCFKDTPEIYITGTEIVMDPNGIFTHRGKNDPDNLVVGRVEQYRIQSGMLYINLY